MDTTQSPEALRYCLYARKSTESDERQAMSIDSQVKEMLQVAERDRLAVVEVKREAHSAKATGERPEFNRMIAEIRAERYDAILTWAPDRLSRNAGDLGVLVDMLDQKKIVEIRTFSQRFTNNPNEKFLLMILGAQGKLENDQKGLNVKRGLRAKCELGLWPAPAPTGYVNEMRTDRKGYVTVDPVRGPVVRQMFQKAADGWSGRKIYRWLHETGFTTVNDKKIWLASIQKILTTPFYYGEFEYPAGSGRWYKGRHEPLISKELYLRVQEVMRIDHEFRYNSKNFAFTRLMRCGLCGSGVTAQEKHKKLKNGGEAVYVYYGCTRSKDINCKGGYLREEELIEQLLALVDSMSVDELGLRKHLKEDIERHQKFGAMLGATIEKVQVRDVDLKNYAKHMLNAGTLEEKRQILSHLKDKLSVREGVVSLEAGIIDA